MTWMKPGVVVQCWDDFYNHKQGPLAVIVDIDGPCTCTHVVAQINQLGVKPLPEHYHLECQPYNRKHTQDSRFWYAYIDATGKNICAHYHLRKVDVGVVISNMETPTEVQLQMDFS